MSGAAGRRGAGAAPAPGPGGRGGAGRARDDADARRERVLAAAAALLDAGQPLRMREVARLAGVSVGALYLCFRSKEALRAAVAQRRGAALERAAVLLRLNPGRSPDASLAALLEGARLLASTEPLPALAARLEPHVARLLAPLGGPLTAADAGWFARVLAACARALADREDGAELARRLAGVLAAGLAPDWAPPGGGP